MEHNFSGRISLCVWWCQGYGERCSSDFAYDCSGAGISYCPMLFILLSFSLCVLACGGRGCPTLLLENTTKRKACIWAWSFSWVELVSGLRGNISCMKCSHFDIWICLCFLPISRFFILCFREIWTHQRLSLWLRNSRWMDDIWETFGDCYTHYFSPEKLHSEIFLGRGGC